MLVKNDNLNSVDRVVNYLNYKGWTVLFSVCQKGKFDIVELFLDVGVNFNVIVQEFYNVRFFFLICIGQSCLFFMVQVIYNFVSVIWVIIFC